MTLRHDDKFPMRNPEMDQDTENLHHEEVTEQVDAVNPISDTQDTEQVSDIPSTSQVPYISDAEQVSYHDHNDT